MNLERTSHWITLAGNAGLLIGLALVIFQINQNSELVREQLDQARWTDDLNLQLALMGENPAAAHSVVRTRFLMAYYRHTDPTSFLWVMVVSTPVVPC